MNWYKTSQIVYEYQPGERVPDLVWDIGHQQYHMPVASPEDIPETEFLWLWKLPEQILEVVQVTPEKAFRSHNTIWPNIENMLQTYRGRASKIKGEPAKILIYKTIISSLRHVPLPNRLLNDLYKQFGFNSEIHAVP